MASNTVTVTIDARPAIDAIAEAQELIRSHASLRAEVEALRADAERYRWIDEHCLVVDRVADSDNFVQVWAGDRRFYGRTLEAAIDAARAAQGEKS